MHHLGAVGRSGEESCPHGPCNPPLFSLNSSCIQQDGGYVLLVGPLLFPLLFMILGRVRSYRKAIPGIWWASVASQFPRAIRSYGGNWCPITVPKQREDNLDGTRGSGTAGGARDGIRLEMLDWEERVLEVGFWKSRGSCLGMGSSFDPWTPFIGRTVSR